MLRSLVDIRRLAGQLEAIAEHGEEFDVKEVGILTNPKSGEQYVWVTFEDQ